jgi:hypothetical protein
MGVPPSLRRLSSFSSRKKPWPIRFTELDTEQYQATATSSDIFGTPTLIHFKAGREGTRQEGAPPAPMLMQRINANI